MTWATLWLLGGLAPGSWALSLRVAPLASADETVVGQVIQLEVERVSSSPWKTQQRVQVHVWSRPEGPTQGPDIVEFLLPGGSMDGIRTWVPGIPTLRQGDVRLFLLVRVHGELRPLAYAAGIRPAVAASLFHPSATWPTGAYQIMETGTGVGVRWTEACIDLWFQEAGTKFFSQQELSDLLDASFERWRQAQGGDFALSKRGYTCFNEVGIADWPGAQNVIFFRDEKGSWPHPKTIAALTTVMYREETGEIVDADIEFNSEHEAFSLEGSSDSFSLPFTLTHELGHLLGLDHSSVKEAVMYVNSVPQPIAEFNLHVDDKAAIVADYPFVDGLAACGPASFHEPTDAFCPAEPPPDGCGLNPNQSFPWFWLFAPLLVFLIRRRA